MTYRQWLVGMALQGLLANPGSLTSSKIVETALQYADDAIAAQERL